MIQFDDMQNVGTLNRLANQLEELSNLKFVKLKAVMNLENITSIQSTIQAIQQLDTYEFDNQICDHDDFARMYLGKNMPNNFDISATSETNLDDFGRDILDEKQGAVTPYGAISASCDSLYEPSLSQSELEPVQDFEEDFDMEMGGMS